MSRQLAELLVKERIISQQQFDDVAQASKDGRESLRLLIEKKYVSETKLLYFLSQKFGLPSINLQKFEIPDDVIALIPAELARKYQIVPIQANKGTIVIAVCDPTNLSFMQDLKFRLRMNVEAVLTTVTAFEATVEKHYGGATFAQTAIDSFKKGSEKEAKAAKESGTDNSINVEIVQVHEVNTGSVDQDAPVITLVNEILADSIRRRASDIHVEPYEKRMRVRMRVDGTLVDTLLIPIEMKRAITARFKIMSRMDIAEQRIPQ